MFTADEYRTAARVLETEKLPGYVSLVDDLMGLRSKAAARDRKLVDLGTTAARLTPKDHPLYTGTQLATYLVASGWTAPEGLF